MLAFPPFRMDLDEGRLWKGETALVLRRKPFEILRYLAQNPRRLVTHDELLANVWGGTVVSESSMRSHLHELRRVLGEGVIETVIGRGYRFMLDVRADVERAVEREPAGGDDPLVVGREAELEQLRAAFERASAGRRQLCFVTGEPGIGKTTLVRTFLAGLDPQKVLVAGGACFEQHGTPEPYLPILEAVGSIARSERGAQALASLVRFAPTFLAQLPHLLDDAQRADIARRAQGGSESRQLRELCEAFESISSREPLALVLEDLQWSDVATIDLLALLGQRQERARLLVLGTSRHAEIQSAEHPLNRVMRTLVTRAGALALPVSKMNAGSVQRFIDRRFPGHAFPAQLSDLVARITAGTPLFMVKLLDELASREMLVEGRLEVSIDEIQAHRPASVKQLIDMQLDRLPVGEQRVLEAASVVGAEFETTLVAAALELPVEQVDDVCDALRRRAQFLRAEPDERYAFHHALIQEVCVERSSPARRRRWHRLVAEELARDPSASEHAHLVAKHFDAAGAADQALPAYVAAARQTAARYASSDAVTLCARALDLLPRLPPSPERDQLELSVLQTLCDQVTSNSFSATFAGRDPIAVHDRGIELARASGDPASVYAAVTRLCNYYMIVAQYERSTEAMLELERIERAVELAPALLHAGIFARAYIAFFRGELETARRLLQRLLDEAPFQGDLAGRALALGHLACVRHVLGDPERALGEAVETIELAERSGVPVLLSLGHVVRVRLRFLRGEPLEDEAEQAVRAAAIDSGLLTEAKAYALWVSARRGPLALAAIEPLLAGLEHRLTEVSTCSTLVALMLIDALRLSGHVERARALADQIVAFATAHDERVYLPQLLRARDALQRASGSIEPVGTESS